jgi:tetratricopeptide (TPR) repeat protein
MKSQALNHLERTTLKPLAPVPRVIAVATILAAFITPSPAIIVHRLNGAAVEVRYFSGTVTHVNQRRRTFALRFQGKGLTKMGYYHPSIEETYRVTDTTAYKGGSWANVTNGVMVRVTGHSDVADTVEFTNALPGEQTGSGTVAPGANVQNAATYIDRGIAKYNRRDFDGAMADYNHAIQLDPQYAAAYNNRGNIKFAKGDLNGAMADYNHSVELDPKNFRAYNNRGLVKFREGDFDGAIREYNRAIELDPNYGLAYRNRGNEKRKTGDLNGAISDYNQSIKLGVTTD